MATDQDDGESTKLSGSATRTRTRGTPAQCWEKVFAPTKRGMSFRVFAVGISGAGKTWFCRRVISEAIGRGLVDVVLTHDCKFKDPEFQDCVYAETPASMNAPLWAQVDETHHVNFRGRPAEGFAAEVDEVAQACWRASRAGLRPCLNIAELDSALSKGGAWRSDEARRILTQGRAVPISFVATTQKPKRCPPEIDDCNAVAFFRLGPKSLNYLDAVMDLPDALIETAGTLENGEFVLFEPGGEWDGRIYGPLP